LLNISNEEFAFLYSLYQVRFCHNTSTDPRLLSGKHHHVNIHAVLAFRMSM